MSFQDVRATITFTTVKTLSSSLIPYLLVNVDIQSESNDNSLKCQFQIWFMATCLWLLKFLKRRHDSVLQTAILLSAL